jgi:5-(carboxyamino)imidazole ribonucleotide mutase
VIIVPEVLVVIGSESDKPIAEKAIATLGEYGVSCDLTIASAHRTPEKLDVLIRGSSAKVFIAIAGLSAALPGAIASKTKRPVIGVPVNVKLDGLDALLSMMQMPSGVPVATVGIGNSKNAAMLAIEILALSDKKLKEKLEGKK